MYEYMATLYRFKDADSCVVEIDFGMKLKQDWDLRLFGCDAPEMFGRASAEEKEYGRAAKAFCENIIDEIDAVMIRTHKKGKFDYLADLYIEEDQNGNLTPYVGSDLAFRIANLSEILIERGHAVPYSGGKKMPWPEKKELLDKARENWIE